MTNALPSNLQNLNLAKLIGQPLHENYENMTMMMMMLKFATLVIYCVIINLLGINGMLALKDEAYKRGWLVVTHQHFEPVPDASTLDVNKQLKRIRQTGTRIVVLNCYIKYSRQVS